MMMLGYARVSTNEQDTAAQVSALKAAGCEKILREKTSGGRWDRPELHRLLDQLRKNDVLVVWRLDRLSRSLRDVLMIMERIKEAEAGFRSLTEAIDTTTVSGTMMMQLIAVFAQFERSVFAERTKAGLDAARKRGSIGGRRPKLRPDQQDEIVMMVSKGTKTGADAARLFKVVKFQQRYVKSHRRPSNAKPFALRFKLASSLQSHRRLFLLTFVPATCFPRSC